MAGVKDTEGIYKERNVVNIRNDMFYNEKKYRRLVIESVIKDARMGKDGYSYDEDEQKAFRQKNTFMVVDNENAFLVGGLQLARQQAKEMLEAHLAYAKRHGIEVDLEYIVGIVPFDKLELGYEGDWGYRWKFIGRDNDFWAYAFYEDREKALKIKPVPFKLCPNIRYNKLRWLKNVAYEYLEDMTRLVG